MVTLFNPADNEKVPAVNTAKRFLKKRGDGKIKKPFRIFMSSGLEFEFRNKFPPKPPVRRSTKKKIVVSGSVEAVDRIDKICKLQERDGSIYEAYMNIELHGELFRGRLWDAVFYDVELEVEENAQGKPVYTVCSDSICPSKFRLTP